MMGERAFESKPRRDKFRELVCDTCGKPFTRYYDDYEFDDDRTCALCKHPENAEKIKQYAEQLKERNV